MEIRDSRLYRETHATFEDYCRERWGWSRYYTYRQIRAADAVAVLPMGNTPTSERAARELVPLAPEERAEVAERIDLSTATAADVHQEVRHWQGHKGVLVNSGEDEWPTPPHIIEAVAAALGAIDLDPCASRANRVPATVCYTVADDGLAQPWDGRVSWRPPTAGQAAGRSLSAGSTPFGTSQPWMPLMPESWAPPMPAGGSVVGVDQRRVAGEP